MSPNDTVHWPFELSRHFILGAASRSTLRRTQCTQALQPYSSAIIDDNKELSYMGRIHCILIVGPKGILFE